MPFQIVEDEFRIDQNASGITATDGTANALSNIWSFKVPDATGFLIRPGDIFSAYLSDSAGPTEIAVTSLVELIVTDANSVVTRKVVSVAYTALTEFSNRNSLYTLGETIALSPDQLLILRGTANLAISTADSYFQVSTVRGTRTIL